MVIYTHITHVHTRAYTHTYIHTHTQGRTHKYTHTHTHTHTYTLTHSLTQIHTRLHIHTHKHIHTHAHTSTHIHTHPCSTGPASRVLSRQLSTFSLQQSLCSPSDGAQRFGSRGGGIPAGGILAAPVRKVLKRIFSSQTAPPFPRPGAASKRRGVRSSVDVSGAVGCAWFCRWLWHFPRGRKWCADK